MLSLFRTLVEFYIILANPRQLNIKLYLTDLMIYTNMCRNSCALAFYMLCNMLVIMYLYLCIPHLFCQWERQIIFDIWMFSSPEVCLGSKLGHEYVWPYIQGDYDENCYPFNHCLFISFRIEFIALWQTDIMFTFTWTDLCQLLSFYWILIYSFWDFVK